MKKIFVMALAAFTAMSCAKDSGDGVRNGGEDQAGKTHVHFTFKLDSGAKHNTRALAEYDPEKGASDAAEADDAKFLPDDMKMLVFNADNGGLEQVVNVTGTNMSLVMTAGKKKFFVFANTANLADNVAAVVDETFNDRFGALTAAVNSLSDVYAKAFSFSAGTPQANGMTDAEKAADRTFNLANLHTRVVDGTKGLPMSSTDKETYTVKGNVTAAEAAVPGSDNNFTIKIYYMLAKARMVMGATALTTKADGTTLSDPYFAVKNLATNTSYIQKWGVSGPESYYHNDFDNTTAAATYLLHFDGATTVNVPFTTTASDYVYVPENTSKLLYRGQSSYYAVKLTWKPGKVATKVAHDANDVVKFSDYKALGTGGTESLDYIYVHTNITLSSAVIPAGTYITDIATFKQALWIADNNATWPTDGTADSDADDLYDDAEDNFYAFKDATSWYRLDLGEGTGSATKYGVLRGNKYTATINNITGPGKPNETDLDDDPTDPVVVNTFIDATIVAAGWIDVAQGGDLN